MMVVVVERVLLGAGQARLVGGTQNKGGRAGEKKKTTVFRYGFSLVVVVTCFCYCQILPLLLL